MLPIKIDLTKELAIKLRQLRLENPVNGEVLTAENLSKAIGNNRAWMSQIESRRLKKIKREDVIAIYKLLFNINSDNEAEDIAESDLIKFIIPNPNQKISFIAHPKVVEEKYKNNPESLKKMQHEHDNENINAYELNCMSIYDTLMDLYEKSENLADKQNLANKVNTISFDLFRGRESSIDLLSILPLELCRFADKKEMAVIKQKATELASELNKLKYKEMIQEYQDALKELQDLCKKIIMPSSINHTIFVTYMYLIGVIFDSPISISAKITYINQYISVLHIYAKKKSLLFTIENMSETSTFDDIKNTMNNLQSFVNSLKGIPLYLLNHVSNYNDDNVV